MAELTRTLEQLAVVGKQLENQSREIAGAREQLEAQVDRYQELFDLAPDPYLVTDQRGVIREANRAAARLLQVRPDHLIGKPLALYVDKTAKKDFLSRLSEIRKNSGVVNWQLRLGPRGSAPVVLSVAVSLHYSEMKITGAKSLELRWVLHDLTEQHQNAETLRESEEKYRSLFENAQEGIYRKTRDGRFTAANPSFPRMLGYDSPDELLNIRASQLYADPGECSRLLNEVENAPVSGREVLLRKKDGEALIASLSMRAIRDKDDRIVAYEGLVQDITERKKLAERLWQRERLAAVGSTIAVLTHEISNPLNGMFTLIQMIERQLTSTHTQDPVLAEHFRDLKLETKRLVDLLGDFRLFAQVQYTFAALPLHELIDEVLSLQGWDYADSGVRIRVELPENFPLIEGDKSKLKQALLNLFKNAVEAMAGEGLLTIKGEKYRHECHSRNKRHGSWSSRRA